MRSNLAQSLGTVNMRKFNFNAGPSMLPEEVLREAQAEMLDWHGTGVSVMELGHRGAEFKQIAEQAEADLRSLMQISDDYSVLFLAGGASTQFAMVPLNLLGDKQTADYIDTGHWSKKAIAEANRYCNVNVAAKTQFENNLAFIPAQANWSLNKDAAYLHYTPNETIDGVAFHWVPKANVPVVADMSSMILSQPIDVNQFGIIYAGAQKNIGQAGLNVVIIRNDLITAARPGTPSLYQYQLQAENHSFYNTPPTYSWYIAGLMFAWIKKQGGVTALYERNKQKAATLYKIIDEHKDFYQCRVSSQDRSIMNVMFYLHDDAKLTPLFLQEAAALGMINLRGHRVSGGVRASIYNAMPVEAVDKLAAFMVAFVKRYG